MNTPRLVYCAKWLGGVILYLAVSALVSKAFVWGMLLWAHQLSVSRGVEYEVRLLGIPAFVTCLFWGALYSSAFAKPGSFGPTQKIWNHLVLSYLSSLLGCVLLVRLIFLRYPEFESTMALAAFPFFLVAGSIVCFLTGIVTWVRLAFATQPTVAPMTKP